MRRRAIHGQRGFTLLEVIVALAVTGLLVASVYAAVDAAVDARDRNAEVQQGARRERNARMLLSSLLRSARVDPAIAGSAFRGEDRPGGRDELGFVGVLALPLLGHSGGEAVRVRVRTEPGQGLVLTVASATGTPAGKGVVLLPGVEALEARYRDPETGAWQSAWTRPDALPDAVALAFVAEPPLPILFVHLPVRATPVLP